MRFLVDAQLPPALARWLGAQGHGAEHLVDLGMEAAVDRAVWDYAIAVGAVVLTKDEDFAVRRALSSDGPSVVWIRCGNTRRRELLIWFEPRLPTVVEAIARGESLIEIA
jgi:predicted nuclease of predicted toxin-antitoxin system